MGVKAPRSRTKTRRKTRDLDQAKADLLSPRHLEIYKETQASEDLPGLGKWYCIECSRWFETQATMFTHKRSKPHKKRVKKLEEEPYSQKEAEAAIGLRTDNVGPGPRREDENEVEMTT